MSTLNAWVPVLDIFSPSPRLTSIKSTALPFLFRYIRPFSKQRFVVSLEKEVIVEAGEPALIGRMRTGDDIYTCYKVPREVQQQFVGKAFSPVMAATISKWEYFYLSFPNLFGGAWEVFNGPEPIKFEPRRV